MLCLDVRTLTFLPTNGFSIKPLTVKLLAGEQKATKLPCMSILSRSPSFNPSGNPHKKGRFLKGTMVEQNGESTPGVLRGHRKMVENFTGTRAPATRKCFVFFVRE